MVKEYDIPPLPAPAPGRGGSGKLIVVTSLVLLLLGAGVFWLTRDDAHKAELKSRMLQSVDNAFKGTPLASVTKYLTPPPPPPPPSVTSPATRPGTLSGQVIQGAVPGAAPGTAASGAADQTTVPTGVDGSGDTSSAAGIESTAVQEVPPSAALPPMEPKVEEDSTVRLIFVEDVAHWLVARYVPGKGPTWGISSLNLRYGGQMHGLNPQGGDQTTSRAWLLRYAFNPSMLTALYNLYADRFVEELGKAAAEPRRGEPLTPQQTDAMFLAYTTRLEALSGALQGIAAVTDFSARMNGIAKLTQQSLGVHTQVSEAVFALDEARESGNKTKLEAAQLRINGLNAQYQRIIADKTMAQQNLLSAIRQGGPAARGLDDDTLMFLAAWVERRMAQDPQASQAVVTAAGLLDNMAGRLRKAASIAR